MDWLPWKKAGLLATTFFLLGNEQKLSRGDTIYFHVTNEQTKKTMKKPSLIFLLALLFFLFTLLQVAKPAGTSVNSHASEFVGN